MTASGAAELNVSKSDGLSQLLEVAPNNATSKSVPSLSVTSTLIVSVVPALPLRVLEEPILLAIARPVTVTGVSDTVMVIDALSPPNEPVILTTPEEVGTRPRLIPDNVGAEVKSATAALLDSNATRAYKP